MGVTASKATRRSRVGGNLDRAVVMANPLFLSPSRGQPVVPAPAGTPTGPR